LRSLLDEDRALGAGHKAVMLVAGAAACGSDKLLEAEAARLGELGVKELFSPGLIDVVSVVAGWSAADRLARATSLVAWPADEETAVDTEDLASARDYFGVGSAQAPPVVGLLSEHAPEALVAYRELHRGMYEESRLDRRLVEMVLFTVCAARCLPAYAAVHAGKAVEAGSSRSQLVEAGLCAVPSGGMPAWLSAANAIAEGDPS